MLLYADEYQMLKHDRDLSLMEMNFNAASSMLREESYATRFQNAADYVERYRPQHFLANLEDLVYKGAINDLKDNLYKEIFSKVNKSGVQKVAFVESQDTLTRLVISQAMKEKQFKNIETQSFDNEEQAKQWLFGKA